MAISFRKPKYWKESKCLSTEDWKKKSDIFKVEYHTAENTQMT